MPSFFLLRPDGSYSDYADYPTQPETREDGEWREGDPVGRPIFSVRTVEQIIEQVQSLIKQAQVSIVNDPLPLARQKQIYDKVYAVTNYLRINAISLALDEAQNFDASSWEDLTPAHQALVTAMKAQIIALLPTP